MKVHTLGDVHLGKAFLNNVPLHRRGDREAMQWAQFEADLETDCDIHVQVGDIFDKMVVPYTVIFRAAMAYRGAKQRHPDRHYVVLRGNHDASRDADKVSAFQVFAELVRPFGIIVVDEEPVGIGHHEFIPWHPFKTALEMLPEQLTGCTVYGHWDVVMGDTNQIPAAELKARGVVKAITGHDHNARTLFLDGLEVQVTGSMQPYSHAEDPAGELYVTIPYAEFDPSLDWSQKCVRIVRQRDEQVTDVVDCLQWQVITADLEQQDEMGQVDFEEFDFDHLWSVATAELSPEMRIAARAKLDDARS